MMIDDNAPTYEIRKLIKTYRNVFPLKLTVVAEMCRETYTKNVIRIEWKNGHRCNYSKVKGNAERDTVIY